jgi:WD40 repeat protein
MNIGSWDVLSPF